MPATQVEAQHAPKGVAERAGARNMLAVAPALGATKLEAYLDGPAQRGDAEDAAGRCMCGKSLRLLPRCLRCLGAGAGLGTEAEAAEAAAGEEPEAPAMTSNQGRVRAQEAARLAGTRKLFEEVQKAVESKQLEPKLRTAYMRTAFQVPHDASVRCSLDTSLAMIDENPSGYPTCAQSNRWYRDPAAPLRRGSAAAVRPETPRFRVRAGFCGPSQSLAVGAFRHRLRGTTKLHALRRPRGCRPEVAPDNSACIAPESPRNRVT